MKEKNEKAPEKEIFRIKPAARHILTIGRDLIKDNVTALLELIKNSYDADATRVDIVFSVVGTGDSSGIKISIADDGHGMSRETVTDAWLVPSTLYKFTRLETEKKKRKIQGRKGIGRYSASVLGKNLRLQTVRDGRMTSLELDWGDFENGGYLEDIPIKVDTKATEQKNGTLIEVTGDHEKLVEWDIERIQDFIKALRRMISPLREEEIVSDFEIHFSCKGLPVKGYEDKDLLIEPFPLLEVFDYRISGEVSPDGMANLLFENGVAKSPPEKFSIAIVLEKDARYCGKMHFDFKLYDRDVESIDGLIKKLKKVDGFEVSAEELGRAEARRLLDEICGVSIYRGGFRIRPHGDPGYDWLDLNQQRVQNPGIRVGSDRVSGYIEIEHESISHLEEKANREGLKENVYYDGLKQIATQILLQAENRRYAFKIKTGKARSKKNLGEKLDGILDFSSVIEKVDKELERRNVSKSERTGVINLINQKVEESNKVLEDVKEAIAIYQGQATLGKIVTIVLHEGRNPLSYFQEQVPRIRKWNEQIKKEYDEKILEKMIDRIDVLGDQSEFIVKLFHKISPLAAKRRSSPVEVDICKKIKEAFDIFSSEFEGSDINYELDCDDDFKIIAWPDDFSQTFINLIDNSLYWLSSCEKNDKKILVRVFRSNGFLKIVFKDNGPGIDEKYIREDIIFEPGFSTKPGGTGLGLAIAGEAVKRSGGKLVAIHSEEGAHFEIIFTQERD